jgi:hypothetical protein
MTTYTPDLGEFRTREGVTVVFGKRPLDDARQEVGWLADQLRPDPIKVNEYGNPVPLASETLQGTDGGFYSSSTKIRPLPGTRGLTQDRGCDASSPQPVGIFP